MSKPILVSGATGKQGGSIINALLNENADFEILAVTRNSSSTSAQKLKQKSSKIKLVEGNLDDPETLFQNAQKESSQPIWGVFSVQALVPGGTEERQGKALVDTALKNNVTHFVYSSVDRGGDRSYDSPTPVPHFISKHNIEHHLVDTAEGTGMTWTILRPVAFFDNFTPNFFGKVFATAWKVALKEKPLQLILVRDIGFFGAQAFLHPEEYRNKGLSLAGDELTFDEMAKIFKDKTGKNVPLTFGLVARGLLWWMKDLGHMFQWLHDTGYGADVAALKEIHPGLKDFAGWLEQESGFTTH